MKPREQILKMQRIILRQLKENVERLQGPPSEELSKYQARYQREFGRRFKLSNKKELVSEIKKSDVVFGADFHPFSQSQRTHLRLLREVIKSKRPVVLALEAIGAKYQKHIDDYMSGKIQDAEFLEKINYFKEWGFPWENYKVFFDFAKLHGLKICGINHHHAKKNDLVIRDSLSAEKISEIRTENPAALIYVLYGDLHLAKSHLPRISKKLMKKTRFITIFQNSEKLYWKLAERKLEQKVDVLKLQKDSFCVVNAPPWLKWQAYLKFLEHKIENEETSDSVDQIRQYNEILLQILQIDPTSSNFEDYHVFEKGDVKFVNLLSKTTTTLERKMIEKFIKSDHSFFVPRLNLFYLRKSEVNHISSLSGQYIHSKLRREKKIFFILPAEFSALIWTEAIGFFMSKIINNRRKQHSILKPTVHQQATLIVLEQRLREKVALETNRKIKKLRTYRHRRFSHYLQAAYILGAILGERIFEGFIRGDIDDLRLRSWLRVKTWGNNRFPEFYFNVLQSLSRLNLKQVKPDERL